MQFFSKKQPDSPESTNSPEFTNSPLGPERDDAHAFPGGPSPDTQTSRTSQPFAVPDGPNSSGAGAEPDSPHVAIASGAASNGNANRQTQGTQQNFSGHYRSASGATPPPTRPDTYPVPEKQSLGPDLGAGATAARSSTDAAAPYATGDDVQRSGSVASRGTEPKSILRNSPPLARSSPSPSPGGHPTSPVPGSITSHETGRSREMSGSAFASGAATSGTPDVDQSLHDRVATADEGLAPKDKTKITKEEQKHGRTLSTIIKGEAATEKAALEVAMKELSEIQKLQRAAVKEEAQMHTQHARAMSEAHKAEMDFLAARSNQERSHTALRTAEETLEESRRHARETTDMMRDKMDEIERLRAMKQADDRERAVKIKGLSGERSGFSKFLGS